MRIQHLTAAQKRFVEYATTRAKEVEDQLRTAIWEQYLREKAACLGLVRRAEECVMMEIAVEDEWLLQTQAAIRRPWRFVTRVLWVFSHSSHVFMLWYADT
jgi:hypothetical protein